MGKKKEGEELDMPLFGHKFSPEQQKQVDDYQAVEAMHRINRKIGEQMGQEAPRITREHYLAYRNFIDFLFYPNSDPKWQTLWVPDEAGNPVEATRGELLSHPEFAQIKDPEEQRDRLIAWLYSLKATHPNIWGPNTSKVINSKAADIE